MVKRVVQMLCGLVLFTGCGSTVPKHAETPAKAPVTPEVSAPAYVAVLPFENRTGDPNLDWLRETISATLSVRLKAQQGWTSVDGSLVRQAMRDQRIAPSETLDTAAAIGLSGVLYAETLITGAFEGKEKALTVTVSHISGETGQVIRTVKGTVQNNNRSALLNQLVAKLTMKDLPAPTPVGDSALAGALPMTRIRIQAERPVRLPSMFQMETPEQIEQAIRLYRRTLEMNPNYADAQFALGYAYDRQGDSEKALTAYREAVTLNPLNADYLYSLGYAYERQKAWRLAIQSYEAALTVKPDDADIAFSLGYAHEQMGEYAEAIEAYNRAIELKPDDYDAYYGLASSYEASGRLKEAFDSFRRVVDMNPENMAPVKTLGAIAVKLERWDTVIETYQTVVQHDPDDAEAYRALAVAYKNQGQTPQAIAAYKEAIRLDPSTTASYTNLGNLYVKIRQYDQAIEQYRAGLKADPTSDLLYYNLGNVLAVQKEYRAAIDAYEAYLRTAPNGKFAQQIRDKLKDLRYKTMMEE